MTSSSESHRNEIRAKMADYLLCRLTESELREIRNALEVERLTELADGGVMTQEEERHFSQHATERQSICRDEPHHRLLDRSFG